MNTLSRRTCWIFDMDGTLTRPVHDFDAIRTHLGVPPGQEILEHILSLSTKQRTETYNELQRLENDLANQAEAEVGAVDFVAMLARRGCNLGIVTRNSLEVAMCTLEATELAAYFASDCVISRDCATPKPSPDGILMLLRKWNALADECVMIGDYVHDVEAGHRAGVFTIHLDRFATNLWSQYTNLSVANYAELQSHFAPRARYYGGYLSHISRFMAKCTMLLSSLSLRGNPCHSKPTTKSISARVIRCPVWMRCFIVAGRRALSAKPTSRKIR